MTETAAKKPVGRPKKPAIPVQETDEFKDAVSAGVKEATAAILQTLAAAQGGQAKPGEANWVEGLAMAIAQLSHQGTGKARPVDPAVIKARDEARKLMTELLVKARVDGAVPQYELRNKIYFAETLVDPIWIDPATKEQRATVIDWPGVPNEAMIPVNDVAKAIHAAFSDSIGVVQIDQSKHLRPEVFGVTAGGLVIHGAGHSIRPMQVGNQRPGGPQSVDEGFAVHGRGGPGKQKTINVLGTVASPARVGAGSTG